jgi:N-methylhydantoinase B/oxoprolinase/acetone carboxylase alpha subunit
LAIKQIEEENKTEKIDRWKLFSAKEIKKFENYIKKYCQNKGIPEQLATILRADLSLSNTQIELIQSMIDRYDDTPKTYIRDRMIK